MAPPPPSSSSSSSSSYDDASFHYKRYDVFISFRGEDTRSNFTSHLRHAMRQKQIEVYMDDEMKKGDEISLALLEAIEDSYISVIVFSEDYASSKWCLDELLKILECREEGQDVIPVFYQIDPSNVRKQKGSYGEAFKKHELDFSNNQDKLTKWKNALFEAANLAGWDSRIHRDESTLIQKIVEDVLKKLESKCPSTESKCPFGTDENLAPIESLLTEFQTVGIWGMGGIGKTTIAKWLFGKYSSQYEGSCFMENIRENFEKDKLALRNYLVSELLGEYERRINAESAVVKTRLSRKKVFVVLDDVSTSEQLEYLDGVLRHFGSGSRIIITSRNRHVFLWKGVDEIKIHHVKELNPKNSLQLFSLNAFKQNHPSEGYEDLSNRAVVYAKGAPLALKVVGSFLYSKSKNEWESALQKLKRIPDDGIQRVLKLSYDGLKDGEKEMFLDIACFFKGERKERLVSLLDNFYPDIGLRILQDNALVTIEHDFVQMHDLIQEMGRGIVRQESIKDPGNRTRLWDPEDVYEVLKYNRGTDKVEGIILDMSQIRDLRLSVDTFRNMINLRFLKFYLPSGVTDYSLMSLPADLQLFSNKLRYLEWDRYPSNSLPLMFCTEKLVEILMPDSHLEKLWDGVQDLVNLKRINLRGSTRLMELPDFSMSTNLEKVDLSYCESLCHIHPSLLSLHSLVTLKLFGCKSLISLESEIHLKSLEFLSFDDCSSLKKFSVSSEEIKELNFFGTSIEILSSSIKHLRRLESLTLVGSRLENLPDELSGLRNLKKLVISSCPKLRIHKLELHNIFDGLQSLTHLSLNVDFDFSELPDNISVLSLLHSLDLSRSNIKCLPASINQLTKLRKLWLSYCKWLRSLPELPQLVTEIHLKGSNVECLPASIKQLTRLRHVDLSDCKRLVSLPEFPQFITHLDLSGSNIKCVPGNIEQLTNLNILYLRHCEGLESLPELPRSITELYLKGSNIESLPAGISENIKLTVLELSDCKSLQSLQGLPHSIEVLDATNCTSLKAVTIKWFPVRRELRKIFYFGNCRKLEEHSISSILETSFIEPAEMLKKFIYFPGNRVPEFFGDNRRPRDVMTITLDRPAEIVTYAFCVVLSPLSSNQGEGTSSIKCYQDVNTHRSMYWTPVNPIRELVRWKWKATGQLKSDHVYVWGQSARCYPRQSATCNSSFKFVVESDRNGEPHPDITIKECGVCPIYAS